MKNSDSQSLQIHSADLEYRHMGEDYYEAQIRESQCCPYWGISERDSVDNQ